MGHYLTAMNLFKKKLIRFRQSCETAPELSPAWTSSRCMSLSRVEWKTAVQSEQLLRAKRSSWLRARPAAPASSMAPFRLLIPSHPTQGKGSSFLWMLGWGHFCGIKQSHSGATGKQTLVLKKGICKFIFISWLAEIA